MPPGWRAVGDKAGQQPGGFGLPISMDHSAVMSGSLALLTTAARRSYGGLDKVWQGKKWVKHTFSGAVAEAHLGRLPILAVAAVKISQPLAAPNVESVAGRAWKQRLFRHQIAFWTAAASRRTQLTFISARQIAGGENQQHWPQAETADLSSNSLYRRLPRR